MIQVFIFEDIQKDSYDPLENKIICVDINKEIKQLEEEGWHIKSIQHQVIPNYKGYYVEYDKSIFTITATKEDLQ